MIVCDSVRVKRVYDQIRPVLRTMQDELFNILEKFNTPIETQRQLVNGFMTYFKNPVEELKKFVKTSEDGEESLELNAAIQSYTLLLKDPASEQFYNIQRIARDFDLIKSSSSTHINIQTATPTFVDFTPTIPRETPLTKTTLVFGCGHASSTCQHHCNSSQVNTHYTVDLNREILPDVISNFYDCRLDGHLPREHFEEVILEGAGDIGHLAFMRLIFNVLKPGGIVRTVHYSPNMWKTNSGESSVDAPVYNSTKHVAQRPILDISYNVLLTGIGFNSITLVEQTDDYCLTCRSCGPQLCARKPMVQ